MWWVAWHAVNGCIDSNLLGCNSSSSWASSSRPWLAWKRAAGDGIWPDCLQPSDTKCVCYGRSRAAVVNSQKNDFNDTLSIPKPCSCRPCASSRFARGATRCQALHLARDRLLRQRLALTNQICGLLLDRGLAIPQGLYALRTKLPKPLKDDSGANSAHALDAADVGAYRARQRD